MTNNHTLLWYFLIPALSTVAMLIPISILYLILYFLLRIFNKRPKAIYLLIFSIIFYIFVGASLEILSFIQRPDIYKFSFNNFIFWPALLAFGILTLLGFGGD